MTKSELYFTIENSLVSIGSYSHGDIHVNELDVTVNKIIDILLNEVIVNKNNSQVKVDFIQELVTTKKIENYQLHTDGINKVLSLPDDYRNLISSKTVSFVLINNKTRKPSVGKYYKVISDAARVNNIWYKRNDIVLVNVLDNFYGELSEINTIVSDDRLTDGEDIQTLENSPHHKSNLKSFLAELVKDQIIIYIPKCDGIEISHTFITYYRNFKRFQNIAEDEELELSSPFMSIVIGEAVKQLKTR